MAAPSYAELMLARSEPLRLPPSWQCLAGMPIYNRTYGSVCCAASGMRCRKRAARTRSSRCCIGDQPTPSLRRCSSPDDVSCTIDLDEARSGVVKRNASHRRRIHRGYLMKRIKGQKPADGSEWPREPENARADAPRFCAPRDTQPRLGVLGIFSPDEHVAHRRETRSGWAAHPGHMAGELLVQFVMRGRGVHAAVINESWTYRDVVFLDAPSAMSPKVGPLAKLMLWLGCATSAWPNARLVGKADDDAYVHLPGVETHLRRSLVAVGNRPIFWGNMESFHWRVDVHRPTGYGYGGLHGLKRRQRQHNCTRRALRLPAVDDHEREDPASVWKVHAAPPSATGNTVGPFYFARGMLYFVARELASDVIAEGSWARAEAAAAIRSAMHTRQESTWPWEDVFLGAALAHIPMPQVSAGVRPQPAYVHLDNALISNHWGFCMANSTFVYHLRTKKPPSVVRRLRAAADRAALHFCEPRDFRLACASIDVVGCSYGGAGQLRWSGCQQKDPFPGRGERTARHSVPALGGGWCSPAKLDFQFDSAGKRCILL